MQAALSDHVKGIKSAAEAFGPRLEQSLALLNSTFIQASRVESVSPEKRTLDLSTALASKLGLVEDIQEALIDGDVLFHHISAITEAIAAFGWVVSDDPIEHMKCAISYASEPLSALRNMPDSSHAEFADTIDAFMHVMSGYVTRNHPSALIFIESSTSVSTETSSGNPQHTAPHLSDFRNAVTGATANQFQIASDAVSPEISTLATHFITALDHMYQYLVHASTVSSCPSDSDRQKLVEPIATCISLISEQVRSFPPSAPQFPHAKAIEEATAMFSWVLADSSPISLVSDAESAAAFYNNKILVSTKRGLDAPIHKSFVESLNAIFGAVRSYIKQHFSTGLRYGIGTDAPAPSTHKRELVPISDVDGEIGNDSVGYVSAFEELISGPVDAYLAACVPIGGSVLDQAKVFKEAWVAQSKFLETASKMSKPTDIQPMLTPIAEKMGKVSDMAQAADPRGALTQHLLAVGESIPALGWIAVDNGATVFVSDMMSAGQFFLDKVKMSARKTSNPPAHREWAAALERVWNELKAYVKEHHTQALVWNPPKSSKQTRSQSVRQETEEDESYLSAFERLIAGPLSAYVNASNVLGGDVATQAKAFAEAWTEELAFLAKAINMPKPDDVQSMLGGIAAKMTEVGAITEKSSPKAALAQHLNAVSESISALGWVAVEEKATAFVGDMASTGQFYIDKVKMGARKTENPEAHKEWSKCLESLWVELKGYVKEYHTQCLVWNPPKKTKHASRSLTHSDVNEANRSDYVTAFQELISGPLKSYVDACTILGGDLLNQAKSFDDAWRAEADFLAKAIKMPKPSDVQSMLTGIAEKIGEVCSISENADPRGALSQHLNAVSESISALGWVAVDEKATVFVSDMSGAGQFYIDKVKMSAKNTENPVAHRDWATRLETLWSDLKAYVKEYHTQHLIWNPPKPSGRASDAAVRSREEDRSHIKSDYVVAFKSLMSESLATFVNLSQTIGGDVAKQVNYFQEAWNAEAEFLSKAINMQKPGDVQSMVGGIAGKMEKVCNVAQSADPRGPLINHLNAVSESVSALGWVAVDEMATGFVGDMAGAGQFYLDKVKMSARATDNPKLHREWAQSLERVWIELKSYVKEYHTQCLSWKR